MSSDIIRFKENLFSLHIIDEGVSVHNEKYAEFLNIDDILVFGFISALYSYTRSIGNEKVNSIDFGTCKFLFESLHDGKLLVLIAKEDFDKEKENEFLKNIKTRYEIMTQTKNIDSIVSLLDIKEKFLPLDLVAEIRKKGQKKSKAFVDEDLIVVPTIAVPDIKIEEFYIEGLMNEDVLTPTIRSNIKKSLSNFFLGYKKLLAGMFVIVKDEQMTSFVFSRSNIEETFPLIQFVINNPFVSESELEKESYQIKKIDVKNQKIWISTYASSKYAARVIFFSISKNELNSMQPHLSRIMYFVNQLI